MSKSRGSGGSTMLAIVVGLFIASQLHPLKHHGSGGGHADVTDASVTWASSLTPYTWARAELRADGMRATACNVSFMEAWARAEGGNWANSARYNPTNTTLAEPGSWSVNSVGVKAYTSWHQGISAEVATLRNGDYQGIQDALSAGNDAQRAADAVASSPWGTGQFPAAC